MSKRKPKDKERTSWPWTLITGAFFLVIITSVWFLIEPGFEPLSAALPNILAILIHFSLKNTKNQDLLDKILAALMVIVNTGIIIVLVSSSNRMNRELELTPIIPAVVVITPTPPPEPSPRALPRITPANAPLPTPTHTPTPTLTPTHTNTPSPTPSYTQTLIPTSSPTLTPTSTNTPIPTSTHTPTSTPTPIPTDTLTPKPTPTPSFTPTPIPTHTLAPTHTPTATKTLIPPTNPPPPTPSPTPTPSITISNPQITAYCINPPEEGACHFEVGGIAREVTSFIGLRIYVFVKPKNPSGGGWYIQHTPATIESDGDWFQNTTFIGDDDNPSVTGHTLWIRAALVYSNATYQSDLLSNLPAGFYLDAIEDIEGLIALSEPELLQVQR